MEIILLGTGTPVLDPTRQHSALLINMGSDLLLMDVGRGATSQMAKVGIHPRQVSAVFLTHHHYDHIGNLGEFLLTAWHGGRTMPLTVYGPPGTAGIVAALFEHVYARDIAFALFNQPDRADIRQVVSVREVAPGLVCETSTYRVLAEYVDHGNGLGLSRETWPCFGYRIEAAGKTVAISGDTVACDGLDRIAWAADCLIQCCYLAEEEITTPALERLARQVIASAGEAGKIAARNQVKRLVLTHIRPKPDVMMEAMVAEVRGAYAGEVVVGEDLMVITIGGNP
jgi:ribonuclease BN (tRNA processing enzyme)